MSFCCDFVTCNVSSTPKKEAIIPEIIQPPSAPPKLNNSNNNEEIPQLQLLEPFDKIIVIDNGSYEIKAGFAGETTNSCVFRNVVGKISPEEYYVGNQVDSNRADLVLNYPITKGIIDNWDDMEKVWNHTFNQLIGEQEKLPVFLTEKPLNPKINREEMTTMMFENFNVPAMYVSNDAVLSLYSAGRNTGIVLQSGYEVTHAVPIFEGHILHAEQSDFGGNNLTDYMTEILTQREDYLFTKNIANDIKEKITYVPLDFDSELKKFADSSELEQEYELPDNNTIPIRYERIRTPEVLFNPNLHAIASTGIHKTIFASIMKCDINMRKDLYNNILLAGGNTMFPGISERLTKEITSLAPAAVRINVINPPERKNSAWSGASFLASLSTFQQMWISRAEYDESGPSIVHRKCI